MNKTVYSIYFFKAYFMHS